MRQDDPSDLRVPVFGTWKAIYAAVIVVGVLSIVVSAVFSTWPY